MNTSKHSRPRTPGKNPHKGGSYKEVQQEQFSESSYPLAHPVITAPIQESGKTPEINDCAPEYRSPTNQSDQKADSQADEIAGLSAVQQQFVLKFCRQLASVIAACDQSESAEIEVGRRQINARQIKVKLQAEREFTQPRTKP